MFAGLTAGSDVVSEHSILSAKITPLELSDGRGVNLLTLLGGAEWPFLHSDTLFVRDFYDAFFNEYLGHYRKDTKVIVSGTPGIGKSAFGLYCIYRALKDDKTVVYHSAKEAALYYVYSSTSVTSHKDYPDQLLHNSAQVVYISDAIRPAIVPCVTILLTSPTKEVWYEFRKEEGCLDKKFGKWDRGDELDLLRRHCFNNISDEKMNEQVIMWGEIPRIALTKANGGEYSAESLKGLVDVCDPDMLVKSTILNETGKDNPTHRLIHIVPTETFDDGGRDFASNYIRDLVYDHFATSASDRF